MALKTTSGSPIQAENEDLPYSYKSRQHYLEYGEKVRVQNAQEGLLK